MAKKFYRSTRDRKIWGVCGGLGEYFNIDSTLIRIAFVLLTLAGGWGLLLYIILALVAPSEGPEPPATASGDSVPPADVGAPSTTGHHEGLTGAYILGLILVVVGIIILLANLNVFTWFNWGIIIAVSLIVIGILLFYGRSRR